MNRKAGKRKRDFVSVATPDPGLLPSDWSQIPGSSINQVPLGFVCGYPVSSGDVYRTQESSSLQGQAINAACVYWGQGDNHIGYPVCRNPFKPFIDDDIPKRMYACRFHNDLRKRFIRQKGIPNGWYDCESVWVLDSKGNVTVTKEWSADLSIVQTFGGKIPLENRRKRICNKMKHCVGKYIIQKDNSIFCNRCQKTLNPGENALSCRWCDIDVCMHCAARECPRGHMLSGFFVMDDKDVTCDACETVYKCGAEIYGCSSCDYDICEKCFSEDISAEVENENLCLSGHILRQSFNIKKTNCSNQGCTSKIPAHQRHLGCRKCKFYVCNLCTFERNVKWHSSNTTLYTLQDKLFIFT